MGMPRLGPQMGNSEGALHDFWKGVPEWKITIVPRVNAHGPHGQRGGRLLALAPSRSLVDGNLFGNNEVLGTLRLE